MTGFRPNCISYRLEIWLGSENNARFQNYIETRQGSFSHTVQSTVWVLLSIGVCYLCYLFVCLVS